MKRPVRYNIIKQRGSPNKATTLTGHKVEKQDYVYFQLPQQWGGLHKGAWVTVRCADYHGFHFLYIDPVYLEDGPHAAGHFFAMCTCGSSAVLVGPGQERSTGTPDGHTIMLVCLFFQNEFHKTGRGRHRNEGERRWI